MSHHRINGQMTNYRKKQGQNVLQPTSEVGHSKVGGTNYQLVSLLCSGNLWLFRKLFQLFADNLKPFQKRNWGLTTISKFNKGVGPGLTKGYLYIFRLLRLWDHIDPIDSKTFNIELLRGSFCLESPWIRDFVTSQLSPYFWHDP